MIDAVKPMTASVNRIALAMSTSTFGESAGVVSNDESERFGSVETLFERLFDAVGLISNRNRPSSLLRYMFGFCMSWRSLSIY